MKKKLGLVLLVLVLSASLFAAVDMRLDLGVQNSAIALDMDLSNSNAKPKFTAEFDATFTTTFDNGVGFYVGFTPDLVGGKFGLDGGFAYKIKVSNDIDCLLNIGPSFMFGGQGTNIGADLMAYFDFFITQSMYMQLGVGSQFEFCQISNNKTTSNVSMTMPLPSFAIGWKF